MSANGVHGVGKCRLCGTDTTGHAYLFLGPKLRGSNKLCIPCAQKAMGKYHTQTIQFMVSQFITENREVSEMARLRNEIRDLRQLLDERTQP